MPDIRKVSEFGQNPFPASEKLQHDFSNTFITEQKATVHSAHHTKHYAKSSLAKIMTELIKRHK